MQGHLAAARLGQVLREKWRLDEVLGVGSMAAVFAATHRTGGRVAIKILHDDWLGDATVRARFAREACAANQISHPGVVPVLDDDCDDGGAPFLVMELLTGETLAARADQLAGPMDYREVARIGIATLEVLGAAHEAGVVHRDVKPANLFLAATGQLRVLDFGLARLRQSIPAGALATVAGLPLGTPAFMPPEQALGQWDRVGPRSDLWSLGATLFYLATGRHVHAERTAHAQLLAAGTARAQPLGTVLVDAPPALALAIDRALAFETHARWPDTGSMREALLDLTVAEGMCRGTGASRAPSAPGSESTLLSTTDSTLPSATVARAASAAATARPRPARPRRTVPMPIAPDPLVEALRTDYLRDALARLDGGDVLGALDVYNAALDAFPSDPLLLCNRAVCRQSVEDFAGALTDLDSAVAVDPGLPEAFFNRGLVGARLGGDTERSRLDLARARELFTSRGDEEGARAAELAMGPCSREG